MFLFFLCLLLGPFPSVHFVRFQRVGFCFILLHLILLSLEEPFCFLIRDRKRVNLDGKGSRDELGGAEKGETIIKICYVRITKLFSIKGKIAIYVTVPRDFSVYLQSCP